MDRQTGRGEQGRKGSEGKGRQAGRQESRQADRGREE